MIKSQTYTLNNLLLNNELLTAYTTNFWKDVFTPLISDGKNKHLMVLVKVHFTSGSLDQEGDELGYKSLGKLRKVNFTDNELFIDYLINRLGYLTESYFSNKISKITFTYVIKDGLALDNLKSFKDESYQPTIHKFNNLVLPASMNPADYGEIKVQNYLQKDGISFERYIVVNGTRAYQIDIYNPTEGQINKVEIYGNTDLTWTDTQISSDLFKREIGKSILYFSHGEIVLRKKLFNCKAIKKVNKDKNLGPNFVTFDIETIKVNNKFIPYLICAYNGSTTISTYANEEIDQKDLFTRFINQLCTFIENRKVLFVYAHNLSKFDGIFLIRELLPFGHVEPLLHGGKLISIKIKLNIKGYEGKTIVFKDSLLLLTKDLRSLCKSYNVQSSKGYFPYLLNNINYIGLIPYQQLWPGIPHQEYSILFEQFKDKEWNFRDEAIKYCIQDCIALHQVLVKFNKLIFTEFSVNIHRSLTLPSLAMRIYKSGFMPENTIYQINGPVEKDIRESYTGGAVDVYKPFFNSNTSGNNPSSIKLMKCYDVNALYPFIMTYTPSPIGKPIAFTGDIRAIEPNAFGYFYCEISSPTYLEHPILQRRIKTSQGIRTIAGLGSWTGWVYSKEMDNAIKFGYTFKIIRGYQFEEGDLFSLYVNTLYELRQEYDKSHPMNMIAKLLMNSLYGKFGMKMEITRVDIYPILNESDKIDKVSLKYSKYNDISL
jgi:DNA polymerase type B, organellar and viral